MTTATAELLQKKTVVKEVPTVSTDLKKIAEQISAYTESEASAALNNLLDTEGLNDFTLGGIFKLYQANSEWWGGKATFKEFVDSATVIPVHYRKVMYLIKIYNCLVDNNIPWDTVKSIGWTKLRDLADVLTADNVDEWVKKAEILTTLQLKEAVKAYLKGLAGEDVDDDGVSSTVTTMTFKVHTDQKDQIRTALDKAKGELDTEFDTVALEGICTAFIGGTFEVEVSDMSLTDFLKGKSFEEVLEAVGMAFPEKQFMAGEGMSDALEAPANPEAKPLHEVMLDTADDPTEALEATLVAFEKAFPATELTVTM